MPAVRVLNVMLVLLASRLLSEVRHLANSFFLQGVCEEVNTGAVSPKDPD